MSDVIGSVLVTVLVLLMARYADEGLRPPWSQTAKTLGVGVVVTVALALVVDAFGGGTLVTAVAVGAVLVGVVAYSRWRRGADRRVAS